MIVLTGSGPAAFKHLPRRNMTFSYLFEACRAEGLDMMLTTPSKVDIKTGVCRGWTPTGHGGRWKPRETRLQGNVVYDAMYLADLKVHRIRYRKLITGAKRCGTIVFNPKLPAKDELYAWLLDSTCEDSADSMLPRTRFGINTHQILEELSHTSAACWLKPVIGSGGRNMLCILPSGNEMYHVHGARFYNRYVNSMWTKEVLIKQVEEALRKRVYLLQDDVGLLQTQDGRKMDFRVTLAKGKRGIWGVTAITARFGQAGGILTNFHAGGSIQSLTRLGSEARRTLVEVGMTEMDLGRVVNVAMEAANRLSLHQPHIGLLGIDVGVAAGDRRALVYDCNSRPGRDILTDDEVKVTMTQVSRFAVHLLNSPDSL